MDSNQALAAQFRVQGIPAVKAFRDGALARSSPGAIPPAQIEAFLDTLVPSEAEELAAAAAEQGDEEGLRRALELDPSRAEAAVALGALLLGGASRRRHSPSAEPVRGDGLRRRRAWPPGTAGARR